MGLNFLAKLGANVALNIWQTTIPHKNNEITDKFYRKVAFLMYTEMVNFMPQSWKAASKQKPHRGLGTRMPSSW